MSSIDTNLNTSPYFDDFDENKNFHRVLFKPSVPVQARELTQLQTILQNQIERFGDNVLKTGTIVSGCGFQFEKLQYVKLSDRNATNNETYSVSDYSNGFYVDASSNLTFQVILTKAGFEVTNPNLQTIVGNYINSGNNGASVFEQGKTLQFYPANGQISNTFTISSGGAGYTNGDTLTFISEYGTGATANVTTNTTGGITAVSLISAGSQFRYNDIPTVNVITSTGSSANIIATVNSTASFTVANNSFETGNTLFNVSGRVATFKVSDGIIYQKGNFVRVDAQRVIVKDYDETPNGYSIGYTTIETLVDYSNDSTLLDNASGFNNENAPGADRLKLTPILVSKTTADADASNNFFSIVRFENGFPVEIKPTTEYNKVGDELARRTFEESGDYVTKVFPMNIDAKAGNTTYNDLAVGAGIAYVKGYRNQQVGTSRTPFRKATDTANVDSASISQTVGNYVYADEMIGSFGLSNAVTVTLLGTATNRLSTAPSGSDPTVPSAANSTHFTASGPAYTGEIVGTARLRSIRYDSETPGTPAGKYKFYLFDVSMNTGKNFADTKAICLDNTGVADIVLENGKAVLKETNNRVFITKIGQKAIKTLNHKTEKNATYFYRTSGEITLQANGSGTVSLTGNNIFDYTASAYLSEEQEKELVLIANNATAQTQPLTGTVNTSSSNVVTGNATDFVSQYRVGDWIRIAGATNGDQRITGITNTTHLTVATNIGSTTTTAAHRRYFPADVPINLFDSAASNARLSSTQSIITVNGTRGQAIESTLPCTLYYNAKKREAQQRIKTLAANTYVKVDCSNNAGNTVGPWSIGLPDVYDIQKVYVHTAYDESSDYDKTSDFQLVVNSKDGYYDLSQLQLKSSSTLTLSSSDKITIVVRPFTSTAPSNGNGYFSVDSYPVDDATTPLPVDKIRTEEIPVYTSQFNGETYDLRDSIDFRPMADATATYATDLTSATINPSATVAFTGPLFTSAPGKTNSIDYQNYLPRYDLIQMSKKGRIFIAEGTPESDPNPPQGSQDNMDLGLVYIPVFPSLSPKDAKAAQRMEYACTISNRQLVRYTMRDIKAVDKRIQKIEYYTSLNLLEKQATDLQIPSSADVTKNRFKNGIIVDNFTNFNVGSLLDREWKAGRDVSLNQLTPRNRQINLDLQVDTLTGTVQTGDLITLPYNHVEFKYQKSATRTRNCSEFFWRWAGTVKLLPDYDNYFDVSNPAETPININVDTSQGVKGLIGELNQIEAIQRPKSDVISSSSETNLIGTSVTNTRLWDRDNTTTVETYQTIKTDTIQDSISQIKFDEVENTAPVGNFVTDVTSSPFIREQEIEVYAYGLKPNTTHYVYFDETSAASNITPCVGPATGKPAVGTLRETGVRGDAITTNENGEVFFKLYIPGGTYKVGDREVLVSEISTFSAIKETSRSFAINDFSAYNFGIEKSEVTLTTKSIKPRTSSVNTGQRIVSEASTSQKVSVISTPRPPTQSWETGDGDGDGGDTGDAGSDDASDDGDSDPLSQTFRVNLGKKTPATGVFVTKVDLYFASKHSKLGITVELRQVQNGYPAPNILPYGQIHLSPSEVNTSTDGSVATTVTFESPVYLPIDKEFCFVLLPDGNNPDYNVFVRKTGENDLITNVPSTNDNFVGSLFLSTNNTAWKPVIDEDVKFIMYRAEFTKLNGSASFVEKDYEFIDMSNINGSFQIGERAFVYDASANISGNVSLSTASETITGTGTDFSSDLVVGDWVALTNGTSHDVKKITAITNATSLTIQGFPTFTETTANLMKTPSGEVYFFENTTSNNDLYIAKSTASNATFKFNASDSIVGSRSGANCTANAIENIDVTSFENLMYSFAPTSTFLNQSATANTSTGVIARANYPMNNRNYLPTAGKLNSKSNQIVSGKSFNSRIQFRTQSSVVSPVVDATTMGIVRYQNIINNDNTNEHLSGLGSSEAKYVSKLVTLDTGLDAEDMRIYVTSTKPPGSNFEVYIRASNELETDKFIDRQWTKMELQGDDAFTNPFNRTDYKEYEFRVPNTPPSTQLSGKANVTSGSATVNTTTDLSTDLAVGDLVKIVNTSDINDYQIEAVTAVTSSTVTVGNNIGFTNSQSNIFKVTQPQTLFKDPQNDNIATYYNSDTIKFETFKVYQIKIVLLASDKALVPRVDNYRAIALSI